jgi:glucoamylase
VDARPRASAIALLATGQTSTPLRALIWLAAIQRPDGSFPQNSWIDGTAYWSGLQLDQVAAPILLAWDLPSLPQRSPLVANMTRSACFILAR